MYFDLHQQQPVLAPGDALRRVGVSLAAGAFLLAVGLAAALLSLWQMGRYLTARLARG
jgi:hypothetical protein